MIDKYGRSYSLKQTYRGSTTTTLTAPTGTAPFFAITGSATRIITVQRITFAATIAVAAANVIITVSKTSTSITGGTKTNLVQVPTDSTNPAGSAAICGFYTAAPTAGTLVGVIETRRVLLNVTGAVATVDVIIDFRAIAEAEGIILRGIAQGIELAYAVDPGNTTAVTLTVEWTEE